MKKRIILWIALAMLLSLGAVLSVSAQQADGSEDVINVTINGNPVTFQEGYGLPYVDNAWRTQVPLRAAMEAYGAYVDWDADARTAIAAAGPTCPSALWWRPWAAACPGIRRP